MRGVDTINTSSATTSFTLLGLEEPPVAALLPKPLDQHLLSRSRLWWWWYGPKCQLSVITNGSRRLYRRTCRASLSPTPLIRRECFAMLVGWPETFVNNGDAISHPMSIPGVEKVNPGACSIICRCIPRSDLNRRRRHHIATYRDRPDLLQMMAHR